MPRKTRRQLVGKKQEDAATDARQAVLKRLDRELHGWNKAIHQMKVCSIPVELKEVTE